MTGDHHFPDVTDGAHGPVTFRLRGAGTPGERVELHCNNGPVAFEYAQLGEAIALLSTARDILAGGLLPVDYDDWPPTPPGPSP